MSEIDWTDLAVRHAIQIAIAALFAAFVVRLFANDRPHLAHAIWVLVLLKSLTPPIIASPTGLFCWIASYHQSSGLENRSKMGSVTNHETSQPVKISILASANTSTSASVTGDEIHPHNNTLQVRQAAMIAWGIISNVLLVIGIVRYVYFSHAISRSRIEPPRSLNGVVVSLKRQLGIPGTIRIIVTKAMVGPAVTGLFRPTLILPREMVQRCSPSELKILVAHELIHVRRGDLWWSAAQLVAASIWFFHPAVWLINRLITRESERSCDEETIASLGFPPGVYARSLLNVLEAKQSITSAPFVPGVRPVDITLKRLERIMRLGHGCHPRTPRWIIAFLLGTAVILLPGASWLSGQDGQQTGQPVARIAELQPSIVPALKAASPSPNNISPIDNPALQEMHESSLLIELKIIDMPLFRAKELQSESAIADAGPFPSDTITARVSNSKKPFLVSETAIEQFIEATLQKDPSVKVLIAPKVVMRSGQTARIEIGADHPQSSSDVSSDQSEPSMDKLGFVCEIRAAIAPDSKNPTRSATESTAGLVNVAFHFQRTELEEVATAVGTQAIEPQKTNENKVAKRKNFNADFAVQYGVNWAIILGNNNGPPDEKVTVVLLAIDDARSENTQTISQQDIFGKALENYHSFANPEVEIENSVDNPLIVQGPLALAGNTSRFAQPTPDEFWYAYKSKMSELKGSPVPIDRSCKVSFELTADYMDAQKFVPLIGDASLHHRNYKCVISSEERDVEATVFIDHQRFILSPNQ